MNELDYKLWAIFVRFARDMFGEYAAKRALDSRDELQKSADEIRRVIEDGIGDAEEVAAVAAHEKASKLKRYCEECGKPADAPDPHVCKECYHRIWDLHCLSCGWNSHLGNYRGHTITKTGDIIPITCPNCKATWWKIVGEEHGVKTIRDRHKQLIQKVKENRNNAKR